MGLFSTYRKLLFESIGYDVLIDSIENHNVIKFYYEGDKTQKKGWRWGEIYALGESTAGNKVIRVFQIKGETDTVIPAWKLFRVDKITDIEQVRTFDRPRPQFNRGGDRSMARVDNIASF